MSEIVEKVAAAIEDAQIGYRISLTRLVDGVETFECNVDGVEGPLEFPSHYDAMEFVTARRREVQGLAAIKATLEHLRDNVSSGMWAAADKELAVFVSFASFTSVTGGSKAISAALSQALTELEELA